MDYASIRPTFTQAAVDTALLIDDAYDPPPDIAQEDVQKAFELVETRNDVEAVFREAGGAWPADFAAFSQSVTADQPLNTVLRAGLNAERKTPSYVLARTLFGQRARDHAAKRQPLDALSAVLKELGIEPAEIGSKQKPAKRKYPLIFLDYYLGDDDLPSVDRSVEKIRTILHDARYGPDEMPLVVLMSSLPPGDELVEQFRKRADLLGCQFVFVAKAKFTAAAFEFVSLLADRAAFLPQARIMGRFVKVWKNALAKAVDAVSEDIATLDLQDFYFIWKKAGDGKNRRFGDHVSNLFDGLLRKQIEDTEGLVAASDAVGAVSFDAMPPNPLIPSPIVARVAHASAFRDLAPFADDYASPPEPLGIDLGELFISEMRQGRKRKRVIKALMVISQACDLEHGNAETVLMVEGTVLERTATTRSSSAEPHRRLRVDIFQFHNGEGHLEDLIIEWDARRMRAVEGFSFHQEMRKGGFERVGRLRALHALAMQQKFAAQLTRVGMPDGLPVYRYGKLEVRVAAKGGGAQTTNHIVDVSKDRKSACVVGEDDKHLVVLASAMEEVRSALAAADPAHYADGAIEKLRAELDDVTKFRRLLQPALGKGSVQIGSVLLRDADEPLPDDFTMPRKALATMTFSA